MQWNGRIFNFTFVRATESKWRSSSALHARWRSCYCSKCNSLIILKAIITYSPHHWKQQREMCETLKTHIMRVCAPAMWCCLTNWVFSNMWASHNQKLLIQNINGKMCAETIEISSRGWTPASPLAHTIPSVFSFFYFFFARRCKRSRSRCTAPVRCMCVSQIYPWRGSWEPKIECSFHVEQNTNTKSMNFKVNNCLYSPNYTRRRHWHLHISPRCSYTIASKYMSYTPSITIWSQCINDVLPFFGLFIYGLCGVCVFCNVCYLCGCYNIAFVWFGCKVPRGESAKGQMYTRSYWERL